ncbi:mannose-6-phosphate isomerase-like protein (cupin superfamily) [Dongia mobilis]|uniref:Mannose-6-phosphate isomerase-like protein (Cupin superfamily) n=1 Tax=Dongia mobilis TaxID=578943 RepID=A0A4R6WR08_9PROT|nr:dimethylsulfonioproprionate lyase family protein [Dongia mobilis]TDQ84005.1 mannose-6-phosphate isomerase-like protein (cupin superfamily) [Dongia mobilis]
MTEELADHWRALLDGIAARITGHDAFAADLMRCRDLPGLAATEPAGSAGVARHWPEAIRQSPLGRPAVKVTLGLQSLGHGWRQNPNYREKPPHPDFLANYGYREWAGPDAGFRIADFRLGILVLGPHTTYPAHQHPAEEIYLPLGPARWWREGGDWAEHGDGDVIHHPPHLPHATETGNTPLAAIYLWRGEIAKAAAIA